jgi:hypothetical protein
MKYVRIFKNLDFIPKKTQYISITKISWFMLFKNNCSLLWESSETHKYTVWAKCRVTVG